VRKVIVTGVDRLTDGLPISIRESFARRRREQRSGGLRRASVIRRTQRFERLSAAGRVRGLEEPTPSGRSLASGGRALPADPPAAAQASATQGKASKGKP